MPRNILDEEEGRVLSVMEAAAKKIRFYFAFEEEICDDYVTEDFFKVNDKYLALTESWKKPPYLNDDFKNIKDTIMRFFLSLLRRLSLATCPWSWAAKTWATTRSRWLAPTLTPSTTKSPDKLPNTFQI